MYFADHESGMRLPCCSPQSAFTDAWDSLISPLASPHIQLWLDLACLPRLPLSPSRLSHWALPQPSCFPAVYLDYARWDSVMERPPLLNVTSSLHLTFQSQPINFHRATISITIPKSRNISL